MAMDHSRCDHPRTPAGRAACRKKGGPGANRPTTPTDSRRAALLDAATPLQPVKKTTTPKASAKAIKRAGTQLRTEADLADVPAVFTPAIRAAWALGDVVRVGEPYNDTERRVEVFGPRGVVYLIWSASNPFGVNDVQFRPSSSSVTTRQPSVNEALRVAGIAA